MKKLLSAVVACGVVVLTSSAEAHTLQIQCKKMSRTDVICRALFSDGDVARAITVELVDEDSDKILSSGKTDAQGMYTFKAPSAEFSVVIRASVGEVTSISSQDIW